MSWWTKTRDTLTGAATGGAIAGPTGAAIGGAVGYHNTSTSGKGDAGKLYADLQAAGLQWSNRGKDGWQNLTEAQVNQALSMYKGYDVSGNGGATLYKQNLQAKKNYFDQLHAQEEMQAAMLEQQAAAMEAYKESMAGMQEAMAGMQEAMAEAANQAAYVPPYNEVLKRAPSAAAGARDETAQRQALRRGLMSTFSSTGGLGGGTDF